MSVKPHVICIVESWRDKSIHDSELSIENYNLFRLDRNRLGGGVLIDVIMSFSHNLVFSGSNDIELLILSVKLNFSVITFIVPLVYLVLFLILF